MNLNKSKRQNKRKINFCIFKFFYYLNPFLNFVDNPKESFKQFKE